jgi:hypothetical protein
VTARRFSVRLPYPDRVWRVRISPDGARLAWLTEARDPRSLYQEMELFRLWTSDLEGGNVQEVGALRVEVSGGKRFWPQDVRWLPDGKRITFVFKDSLWVAPASPPA